MPEINADFPLYRVCFTTTNGTDIATFIAAPSVEDARKRVEKHPAFQAHKFAYPMEDDEVQEVEQEQENSA